MTHIRPFRGLVKPMNNPTATNVKVRLEHALIDELARLSVETGLSRSALIRLFITKAVRPHAPPEATEPKEFCLDDYLA